MEFAGKVAGVSGSHSGDGECFKMAGALDGVVDVISGEGERSGCNGFTGASSALLSPPESSTGLNAMAGSGSNGSGVRKVCLRPEKYLSSNSARSEMMVFLVVGL